MSTDPHRAVRPTGATEAAEVARMPMRFGPGSRFELQLAQYRLLVDGRPCALKGRALDLLFALASRPGELFTKEELLAHVWPGLVVEENNLRVQVNSLRKTLGGELIVTVPGRGYRLAVVPAAVAAAAPPATDAPHSRRTSDAQPRHAWQAALPAELDAFVGRKEALALLAARLDSGHKLVTVVGPGGTGKTRLVRRYLALHGDDWPGGVFFCDLSEARTVGGIVSSMAGTLNVSLGADDPLRQIAQLGQIIADRGRCLVVLDNFEQITAHAEATLGSWMAAATQAVFIVTSRELLALKGEQVYSLAPMQTNGPGSQDGDGHGDGVELFAVRAQARRSDFLLTPAVRSDVAQIVTLLDGLPLAIELAAARVTVFSPPQLLARLKDRFALLVDPRATQPRQATLRASIDWSWSLLEPWERAALAQSSVFAGGFTMEAAESLVELSAWPKAPPVMDVIQSLLDRSLLRCVLQVGVEASAQAAPRFSLLISIREYAAAKLEEDFGADAAQAARHRHGQHYARFGTEDALDAVDRHGGLDKLRMLGLELENLVTACLHAVHAHDVGVAMASYAAAWRVLQTRGPFQLGIKLGQQVLALPGVSAPERAHATRSLAHALRMAGRTDEASHQFQASLLLYQTVRNRRGQGEAWLGLADLQAQFQGGLGDARLHLETALALFVETGDRHLEAVARGQLGTVFEAQGQQPDSDRLRWQAVAIHREVGHRRMEAHELGNLACASLNDERWDEALGLSEQALAIARACADRRIEGHVLSNRGLIYIGQGRREDARRDFMTSLAIAHETGNQRFESNVRRNLGELLALEQQPQEAVAQYEQALMLAREVGNVRGQVRIYTQLAGLQAAQGHILCARQAFAAAAALLNAPDHAFELGLLLCEQGELELAAGQGSRAQQLLDQAQTLSARFGSSPPATLQAATCALREALRLAGLSPAQAAAPTAT